jgi:hypothetical protein
MPEQFGNPARVVGLFVGNDRDPDRVHAKVAQRAGKIVARRPPVDQDSRGVGRL